MKRFMLVLFCWLFVQHCEVISKENENSQQLTGDGTLGDSVIESTDSGVTPTEPENSEPTESRFASQGTLSNPISIAFDWANPKFFYGEVAPSEQSYYVVTIESNVTLVVQANGIEQPVNLYSYSDATFDLQPFCFSTLTDSLQQQCLATTGHTYELFIEIDDQTGFGTDFEFSVSEAD